MPFSYSNSTTRAARLRPALVFAASLLPAAGHAAEVVADLAPVGAVTAAVPSGLSGLALSLIERELFNGVIAANDGTSVTVADSAATPGRGLVPEGRYFLEVQSGPLEGERLDIDTVATRPGDSARITLDLGADSLSTLNTLPADALAGARCALRGHVTLSDLPAMFTPPLTGSNNPNLGDAVQVLEAAGFTTYYLRGDGQTWRRAGSSADMRHLVIPPDASIMVRLASGPKQWVQTGSVRTNAFRKNLAAGVQSFASGFPVPQSPAELGATTDLGVPEGLRWEGSNNPAQADSFLLFAPGTGTFRTYYLRGDGASWFQMGGSASDISSEPFVHTPGLTLLDRKNADRGFLILPPSGL